MANPFDFSDFSANQAPQQFTSGSQPNGQTQGGYAAGQSDDPLGLGGPAAFGGAPVEPAQGINGWGTEFAYNPSAVVMDEVASPPILWCAIGLVAALAGIALAVIGWHNGILALIGWGLAGPIAIGLLARHTIVDTARRATPFYSRTAWASSLYWTVLVLAFGGVAACAWPIADWVARS